MDKKVVGLDSETKSLIESTASEFETERAYFGAIWEIEDAMFEHMHDLSRGEIEPPEKERYDFDVLVYMQRQLLKEIEKKFGIVYVDKEAGPEFDHPILPGKRDYDDWYQKMDEDYKKEKFEKIICSVCPFCKKTREMSIGVPCSLVSETVASLCYPWICLVMDEKYGRLSRDVFFQKLFEAGGENACKTFLKKERELKKTCAIQIVESMKEAISEHDEEQLNFLRRNIHFLLSNNFSDQADELILFIKENAPGTLLGLSDILPQRYKI